jgi:hypothetical protein
MKRRDLQRLMKKLAEKGVNDEAEIDSVDSLICAYESRMRMDQRDSAIDAETLQSRGSMAMIGDDVDTRFRTTE